MGEEVLVDTAALVTVFCEQLAAGVQPCPALFQALLQVTRRHSPFECAVLAKKPATVGERIKAARAGRGVSLTDLADIAADGYLSEVENGIKSNLSTGKLELLAERLIVRPAWLQYGALPIEP